MERSARSQLGWIGAAGVVGFASAFGFGDVLRLSRGLFLVPHLAVTLAFLAAYARWSGTDLLRLFSRNVVAGLVAVAVVGPLLVFHVVGQPASARSHGLALWLDLLWLGVAYGAADALLLSVLPVVASWRAGARLGWTSRRLGRLGTVALGLFASAFVTAAYHLGYAEFRGPAVGKAVVGNTMMSAAQVLTASPLAAAGSHVVMHVAAVLHGPDTTVQLPPHRALPAAEDGPAAPAVPRPAPPRDAPTSLAGSDPRSGLPTTYP